MSNEPSVSTLEEHAVVLAMLEAAAWIMETADGTRPGAVRPWVAARDAFVRHVGDGWSVGDCIRRMETLAEILWPEPAEVVTAPPEPETREQRLARLRRERNERLGIR